MHFVTGLPARVSPAGRFYGEGWLLAGPSSALVEQVFGPATTALGHARSLGCGALERDAAQFRNWTQDDESLPLSRR